MSDKIKAALAKAKAIVEAAQKRAESRKVSPEELAERRHRKAEREEAKKILAEAYAERDRILGIVPNPELEAYKKSPEARYAVSLLRSRRPGDGTAGAVYWDAALQLAGREDFAEYNSPGWNKRFAAELQTVVEVEEKRAQIQAVLVKKTVQAIAEGMLTTDGQLTAAGEGVVEAHKAKIAEIEDSFDPDADDDDEGDDDDAAVEGTDGF